jgi:hypothetical protein
VSVEEYPAEELSIVSVTGPYSVPFSFSDPAHVSLRVFEANGDSQLVDPANWTLTPTGAGPGGWTGGTITLSSETAAALAGLHIQAERDSNPEQGWAPAPTSREAVLAAQLDWLTRAVQDARRLGRAAIRLQNPVKPFAPSPGALVIFDADGQPTNGPNAEGISEAAANAARVEAALALFRDLEVTVSIYSGEQAPLATYDLETGVMAFELPEGPTGPQGPAGEMTAATYDPTNKAADAFARANHSGAQAISTVTGLQTALDAKLTTAAVATQEHAEAGTNTTNWMTPQRVKQALRAGGSAPMYACRAWVNFDGTTGVIEPNAGGNVTSIGKNGTGDYTLNFTTALPDTAYAVTITTTGHSATDIRRAGVIRGTTAGGATTKSTTQLRIQTGDTATGALVDMAEISVMIFR